MSAHICRRCSHQWESRKIGKPVSCPACKTYRWQAPVGKTPQKASNEQESAQIRQQIAEIDKLASELASEVVEDWTGWSDERTTEDTERGETITYRQHLKSGRKKEIRRESSW